MPTVAIAHESDRSRAYGVPVSKSRGKLTGEPEPSKGFGPTDWAGADVELLRRFVEVPERMLDYEVVNEDDTWMDLYNAMILAPVETAWATFLCLLHTVEESFPEGPQRDEALSNLWVRVAFALLGEPDREDLHDRLIPEAESRWPLLRQAFVKYGVPMWTADAPALVERRLGRENPYSGMSTPMIKGRLFDLTKEMHLRSVHKSTRLAELIQWTMTELPDLAPDDPRTQRAVDLAVVLWENSRDIGG